MNQCECKIKLAERIAADSFVLQHIEYCPLHESAPRLQAENERLREALKVAKEAIQEIVTTLWLKDKTARFLEPIMSQIDGALGVSSLPPIASQSTPQS